MFTFKIENANNQIFELTHNTSNYALIGIEGLTPPPANVNTATAGTIDGTFYNSSRVEQRNIVLTIVLNGDIEGNRQRLYKMFPRKVPCTIYFTNANRNVQIQGYVETIEGDLFSQREQIQISIICPRPYFEDLAIIYTELAQIVRMFSFPFSISTPIPFSEIVDYPLCTIDNGGDAISGCTMSIAISGDVTGLNIVNSTQQTFFGLDYTFQDGDTVTIDTHSGQMGVTLSRNGVTSNLLNYVTQNSTWFRLSLGENNFTYTTSEGSEYVRIIFATANLYGGV